MCLAKFDSEANTTAKQLKQYELDNAEVIERCRNGNATGCASNERSGENKAVDEDGGMGPDAEDGDNGRKRVRKPSQLAQPRPISMRPMTRNHGLRFYFSLITQRFIEASIEAEGSDEEF